MSNGFLTLGIETSCDETSAAVVADGRTTLTNIISSQVEDHSKFGGVVPEVASRKHIENIIPVVEQALNGAGVKLADIDLIGVTAGPGLVGALLVGVSAAKAMAYASKIPLVGVNHIEGHICANFLTDPDLEPPFLCLVVSGGHTHLVYMKDIGDYDTLGFTRDDAAGEAFDKTARALGLGYPGGPIIDRLANKGNPDFARFPQALMEPGSLDFSFSGVKTAVVNFINNSDKSKYSMEDVCASFQKAVVDVLVEKAARAIDITGCDRVVLAGGVASNSGLRQGMKVMAEQKRVKLTIPPPVLCTDNAAMVACAAYFRHKKGEISGLDLNAYANMEL
jgi:N6-L-threonylcarbamoyladenine synthase